MDILNSIEMRWFLDVNDPVALVARAAFADVPLERGQREHRYLLTGREDYSFKARIEEGSPQKIESKYLLGSLGPMQLHERCAGNVERWRKLSFAMSDNALQKDGVWVRVNKSRRLRKLAYEDGTLAPVPSNAILTAGCGIELTELEYEVGGKKRRSLTMALDAFGPERVLLDILMRACADAFEPKNENESESTRALHLGVGSSASYPRWLARVTCSI